jgi:hypothetical protein
MSETASPYDSQAEAAAAYRLLVRTFRRPYGAPDPDVCVYHLVYSVSILLGSPAPVDAMHRLEAAQSDILMDAFMYFVCAPRTRAELEGLLARFVCAGHDESARDLNWLRQHEVGTVHFNNSGQPHPIHYIIAIMGRPWSACNTRWKDEEPALWKTAGSAGSGEWPQTTPQILPHRAEDSVRGLVQWLSPWTTLNLSTRVQLVFWIEALLWGSYSETIPYFMTSHTLLAGLLHTLSAAIVSGDVIDDPDALLNPAHALTVMQETLRSLRGRMTCAEFAVFTAPRAAALARACDAAAAACGLFAPRLAQIEQAAQSRDLSDYTREGYRALAGWLYAFHPNYRSEMRDLSAAITLSSPLFIQQYTPWVRLLGHLRLLHHRHRCCAPDCSRTWADEGRAARYCLGCYRVHYCSVSCQKANILRIWT